ncbi:beta-ketoacyl-[acyl-carrier-protein] synthase family protein [Thiohalophilus sp.]|uniref:beta-ketoacyl-[acyl-carrier-protein] synthase family protein n=1 Tax=Thiohalophilus sp. TaxID=3028392 RepID=UPI002ACDD8C1|nr:beta-ketoacyl-[acyl-carrier-protein] synthase family protein [Thiohalophilus sp.]MDZ7663099.1 beta-ketoacyl-[acyl-carrier-protein] synthase family protein [Thiohalophilus sp.]
MSSEPLLITASSTVSALGRGIQVAKTALLQGRSGLRRNDYDDGRLDTWIGRVEGVENVVLPGALAPFDCRNNRLAALGLETDGFATAVATARQRYGARRIGLFLGTSTSGIEATEQAYLQRGSGDGPLPASFDYRHTHNTYSCADFTRQYLELEGPAQVISTACSSSAKVFATASRYIQAGWCDAAVIGGIDSLCLTTLLGFNALELVSAQPCRPWDRHRNGINIGEAAGFALLEPDPGRAGVALLGYGESSDAYHMSTPHPQGEGALLAMRRALDSAGLTPVQVDYINLHGTATSSNDRAEDQAVTRLFKEVPCSSTKGWTGHTLGAAGITEAVFCKLAIENGLMPGTLNLQDIDPGLSAPILRDTQQRPVRVAMSNSFGFGGSNCALVFGWQG